MQQMRKAHNKIIDSTHLQTKAGQTNTPISNLQEWSKTTTVHSEMSSVKRFESVPFWQSKFDDFVWTQQAFKKFFVLCYPVPWKQDGPQRSTKYMVSIYDLLGRISEFVAHMQHCQIEGFNVLCFIYPFSVDTDRLMFGSNLSHTHFLEMGVVLNVEVGNFANNVKISVQLN